MNREAINFILDACEAFGWPVQITLDSENDQYIADFQYQAQASACFARMRVKELDAVFNPPIPGERGCYFARIA